MTTWLSDSFTEASDVTLASHTPEVGGAWSAYGTPYTQLASVNAANDWVVGASSSSSALYLNAVAPPSADYVVEAVLRLTSGTTGDRVGVVGRYTSSGAESGYLFYYDGVQWILVRASAGVYTTVASYNGYETVNTDYTVQVYFTGEVVEVYIDLVKIIAYYDPYAITSAGKVGIFCRSGGAISSLSAYDLLSRDTELSQLAIEALSVPSVDAAVSQIAAETAIIPSPDVAFSQSLVEVLTIQLSPSAVSQMGVEVLIRENTLSGSMSIDVGMEADNVGIGIQMTAELPAGVDVSSDGLALGTELVGDPVTVSVSFEAHLLTATTFSGTVSVDALPSAHLEKGIEFDGDLGVAAHPSGTLIVYPEIARGFFLMF